MYCLLVNDEIQITLAPSTACKHHNLKNPRAHLKLWAPRLYEYYHDHQRRFHEQLPHLRRNFPKSVFSCAAFNLGPRVWTFRHRDVLNVPFGWCAIQAAGRFNPKKATLSHSNVPVRAGEERLSFTQFTAGGLMRFVDNGFRTQAELEQEDPAEYARMMALKASRWEMGLGLLSTSDELLEVEGKSLPATE
ncbi:hypothetical protein C8R43DRAFT_1128776 [Mycena crocata]|nr:hypothetical protein C8R43DRAFT_1128776 [Mycena crocata]